MQLILIYKQKIMSFFQNFLENMTGIQPYHNVGSISLKS